MLNGRKERDVGEEFDALESDQSSRLEIQFSASGGVGGELVVLGDGHHHHSPLPSTRVML